MQERPLRLDITATSLGMWHVDNRNTLPYDDHYGEFDNRLNFNLSYWRLVAALRIDTGSYFHRPDAAVLARNKAAEDAKKNGVPEIDPELQEALQDQYTQRLRILYRNAYYVGKAYVTYSSPELEVTAGDSYVSFGRGLVLSLRKQDELAIDTTLLGGKVIGRLPHLTLTGVGGIANPVRIDEATGESLYPLPPTATEAASGRGPILVYGQDVILGGRAEVSALTGSLAVHAVRLLRETPFAKSGISGAKTVDMAGGSLQSTLPNSGSAYLEVALQKLTIPDAEQPPKGYAIYGSASSGLGTFSGLIELQHYRRFDALTASLDKGRADAFQFLRYSAPPTTEPITTDTRYLFFDRCVTGGRVRVDDRVLDNLLVYGAVGRFATWSERGSGCREDPATEKRNDVTDLASGVDYRFQEGRSRLLTSGGVRYDQQAEDGALFYREWHAELSVAKALTGPFSLEFDNRFRRRRQGSENLTVVACPAGRCPVAFPWIEGESYLSLKWTPVLSAGVGFEYTTLSGRAPTYFNLNVLYRYTPDSTLKLIAGQQRGALKCVSGVCREFPPFEGVRLEWTQRY